ncbi:alpha-L-arabinofuranosidase [Streptomyces sp. SID5914]|nr:alpha-L-arabinofuranosidase C-terminal domain-containing protein [Streptomyces sp. SID5914]MZG12707.1 alpha-L-arabinofuranosidase [Streptomyces sp. SID5914]
MPIEHDVAAIDQMKIKVSGTEERPISTELWGAFFEDINYAADGGLASNLVQNGAFEYNYSDLPRWTNYTAWDKEVTEGAFGAFCISAKNPVTEENPHHAVIEVHKGSLALTNEGFDGMVFAAGQTYGFAIWARSESGAELPLTVELLDENDRSIGSAKVVVPAAEWTELSAEVTASADTTRGRLRLGFSQPGVYAIDFVSLEPRSTYNGLEHMRADLVEALAELHPRFLRFPGGCIVHGNGMDNMYDWKNSVGPVEHRRHNFNIWGYHQSFRIGFYEYLRLCEEIGAKPLPVLPGAVTCPGTDKGPVPIPQSEMGDYIQGVLDFIEFCNGGPDTTWGSLRAEMGHPASFGVEMLGLGNEDQIDAVFESRMQQILDAVRAAHPEITIVGTSGGWDYLLGRETGARMGVPIMDEHQYRAPAWWFRNSEVYADVRRGGPQIYLGEYGSNGNHMINALSEAVAMSYIELNGDVVTMASYAPLFAKCDRHRWTPNLMYFDNEHVYRTYNYWVQQMFLMTAADSVRPVELEGPKMYHRDISDRINLGFGPTYDFDKRSGTVVDFSDIEITLSDGSKVAVPQVRCAEDYVDAGLDLHGDAYTVTMCMTHVRGTQPVNLRLGDGRGSNHYYVSLSSWVRILSSDAQSGDYEIARLPFDSRRTPLRPGTVWDLTIKVADRGRRIQLFINGEEVLDGLDDRPEEPRRTATVARNADRRKLYVRLVNALPSAMDVDLTEVLGDATSLSTVTATVLAADGPFAGGIDEDAPTVAEVRTVNLASSPRYRAEPWSFTILTVPEARDA